MGDNIKKVAEYSLDILGLAVHSWEENGDRMIAVGHSAEPYFTLLKWDGESLLKEDDHDQGETVEDLHTWEENGNRMIGLVHSGDPYVTVLEWNGTVLSEKDTYTTPGSSLGIDTWEESGNRMLAIGHRNSPYFTLLKWNGTSLSLEDTYNISGDGVGGVHTWPEGGNRIIAVGNMHDPHLYLLEWDGTSLSEKYTYWLDTIPRAMDSWVENGNRMLVLGYKDASIYKWNGESLSKEATCSVPTVYGLYVWEESEDRMIAVVTYFGDTYFYILKWDGETLSEQDTYTLPDRGYDVHGWNEDGEKTIVVVGRDGWDGIVKILKWSMDILTFWPKIGPIWKTGSDMWVKVGAVWKKVIGLWIKEGADWKEN